MRAAAPAGATDVGWSPFPLRQDAITDVPGIRVGHATDRRAATGCTVVLCEDAALAAVDARGGAPGTRETDVLNGANVVRRCHAVLLAGGSAFGLAAASGVMRLLRERGVGFETTAGRVPIVSAAVLFDLALGRADAFPGEAEGYDAARRARGGQVRQGQVGAGTGATVAKMLGNERRQRGGLGSASVAGPRCIVVGALVVTNAVGSVYDPETAELLAGPAGDEPGAMLGLEEVLRRRPEAADALVRGGENTTLVCVATNATLEHGALQRLTYHAHDGIARCIVPAHTFGDGDVAFAIATAAIAPEADDPLMVGVLAQRATERAIVKSLRAAPGG